MFCMKCGTELPAEAGFCWKCGQPVTPPGRAPAAGEVAAGRSAGTTGDLTRASARPVATVEDLLHAIETAPPGATIQLQAGTYTLPRSLRLTKPLSLLGAGMATTRIVAAESPAVVAFAADGLFAAQELTFEYQRQVGAHGVQVTEGVVNFRRCRFTGAIRDENPRAGQTGGYGLWLSGKTTGTVAECEFQGNAASGILIDQQAQPTLVANTCRDNKRCGIAYFDNAGGTARENQCFSNGLQGIRVGRQAQPTLEANTCRDNKEGGIGYFDSAEGTARQNQCCGNGMGGITVGGQAQPTLEANTCRDNKQSGILYFESAGGTARQNQCVANGVHGIGVQGQAQPTLEANTCRSNTENGIAYLERAGGAARRNSCFGNFDGAVYVAQSAHPILADNSSAAPAAPRSDAKWEYREWVHDLRPLNVQAMLGTRVTPPVVRMEWWSELRPTIVTALQDLRADGWEPAADIGPDCLVIEEQRKVDFLVRGPAIFNPNTYLYLREVRIQLHRPR